MVSGTYVCSQTDTDKIYGVQISSLIHKSRK